MKYVISFGGSMILLAAAALIVKVLWVTFDHIGAEGVILLWGLAAFSLLWVFVHHMFNEE